jgi:hypothetical protein
MFLHALSWNEQYTLGYRDRTTQTLWARATDRKGTGNPTKKLYWHGTVQQQKPVEGLNPASWQGGRWAACAPVLSVGMKLRSTLIEMP